MHETRIYASKICDNYAHHALPIVWRPIFNIPTVSNSNCDKTDQNFRHYLNVTCVLHVQYIEGYRIIKSANFFNISTAISKASEDMDHSPIPGRQVQWSHSNLIL